MFDKVSTAVGGCSSVSIESTTLGVADADANAAAEVADAAACSVSLA